MLCPNCGSKKVYIPNNKNTKCKCISCNYEFKRENGFQNHKFIPLSKMKNKNF